MPQKLRYQSRNQRLRKAERPTSGSLGSGMIKSTVCWWVVRVTLVVDCLFLPQNFGLVVGTYEGLLPSLPFTPIAGDGDTWPLHVEINFFSLQVVGTLKPSI